MELAEGTALSLLRRLSDQSRAKAAQPVSICVGRITSEPAWRCSKTKRSPIRKCGKKASWTCSVIQLPAVHTYRDSWEEPDRPRAGPSEERPRKNPETFSRSGALKRKWRTCHVGKRLFRAGCSEERVAACPPASFTSTVKCPKYMRGVL